MSGGRRLGVSASRLIAAGYAAYRPLTVSPVAGKGCSITLRQSGIAYTTLGLVATGFDCRNANNSSADVISNGR